MKRIGQRIASGKKIEKIGLAIEAVVLIAAVVGLFGHHDSYQIDTALMAQDQTYYVEGDAGYTIDESSGYTGIFTDSSYFSLPKGSYNVVINYSESDDLANTIEVQADGASYHSFLSNEISLTSGDTQVSSDIWVTEKEDQVHIVSTYNGTGSFTIRDAYIYETNALAGMRLFTVICVILIINAFYYLFRRNREKAFSRESKTVALGLAMIIFIASIPVFTDYIGPGADLIFHLLRIEGIKEGILSGQFPVRLHPNWLQGYGYASAIFYSDTFLYFPALLRLIGFTVGTSYKCYIFAVNVATCLLSYWCFSKIFKNKYVGVFGSMLYTMSAFRLINIYTVAAVGQYSAITFLPLVMYGFYRVFTEDTKDSTYKTAWIPLSLGLSGLLQTHVITCIMSAIFILLGCIILWKKTVQKTTFGLLVKTVVVTLLMNVWYLIPFLDYNLNENFAVTTGAATQKAIQEWGMFLPQLLNTFFFSGGYGAYEAASGVMGESAYGIGAALILGALAFIYYLVVYYRKKEYDVMTGTGKMMFGMGILSLFMASVYFPWDRLQKTSSLMGKVIATIQFPNRFVELSILFFTIVACVAAVILYQNRRKWALPLYMGILAGVMLISTTFLVDNMMYNMTAFHIYDADCMGNGYVAGGEYVLLDTDVEALKAGTYAADAGTTISGCSKKYCNVTVICSNAGAAEGYVEVPLLYYKGYQAAVLGTSQQLTITPGDNNVLRVSVPAGFNGTIQIGFHTLWYWRIAELISLAALVFLVVCACRNRKKSDGEIA